MRKQKHLFNQILNLELDERENRYTKLTTTIWERKISKKIFDFFDMKYVEEVDEIMLNRFFSIVRYKENGEMISDKYMKAIISLVKSVLKKSFMRGYITINPFDYDYKPPKGRIPEPTKRFIDDTDLKHLLNAVTTNKRLATIIPILLLTGLRIGELLALYWSDIDFENKQISVNKSVICNYQKTPTGEIIKNGMTIANAKTKSSNRIVPVNDAVLNLLRNWLIYRDERAGWKDLIIKCDNINLVFPNYAGKIMNENSLYKELIDFLKANHLENCSFVFHKLRHCYATHMLDSGVDIDVISKLLGHKSITTTANVYVNVSMLPKVAALKKHDKYLQKNLPELY